jgi:hypothetical protein
MNDYYSNFPKPPFADRFKDCMGALSDIQIPNNELEKIVTNVVNNDKDYSLTGYRMFGMCENIDAAKAAVAEYITMSRKC